MSTVHQRRIEQEWRLLQALAEANPSLVEAAERDADAWNQVFRFKLQQTQALVEEAGKLRILECHAVTIHFPRFFPAVPLETSLVQPVFHPNVHPETGFVCLWDRFSFGDTVVEAVAQLQRVITWQLWNEHPDHLLQPASLGWYKDKNRDFVLPLSAQSLQKPEGFDLGRTYARRPEGFERRRLG